MFLFENPVHIMFSDFKYFSDKIIKTNILKINVLKIFSIFVSVTYSQGLLSDSIYIHKPNQKNIAYILPIIIFCLFYK